MTKPKLSFGNVQIREYPVVLSNNPAGNYGPPVELGWEYFPCDDGGNNGDEPDRHCTTLKVSAYEKERQRKRRTTAANPRRLYLSPNQREAILKAANYSEKDIKKAVRDKNKARRQRSMSTFFTNPVVKIQINREAARREKKLKRAKRNFRKQKDDPELFHEHDSIYSGWWLPFSGDLF